MLIRGFVANAIVLASVQFSIAQTSNPPQLKNAFQGLDQNVGLLDPTAMVNGQPMVYSTTNPTQPDWFIAQWAMQSRLPNWSKTRFASFSSAPAASVTVGPDSLVLAQDSSVLSCMNGSAARELDIFFSPREFAPIPLSSTTLFQQVDVRTRTSLGANAASGCKISQGGFLIGYVLSNASAKQTLFYQLNLRYGSVQNGILVNGVVNNSLAWYAQQNPFGADDYANVVPTDRRFVSKIDLAAKLSASIINGPSAMDHDPKNWAITSVYGGQHTWGDVKLSSRWNAFQIWYK